MSDRLSEIKAKCEQYWNEDLIGPTEVHAILEFIHVRAVDAIAEVERLEASLSARDGRMKALQAKLDDEIADGTEKSAVIGAGGGTRGAIDESGGREGAASIRA